MSNLAIRTQYNGQGYASQLEASYAALFDYLQIPFIYEPPTCDLGGGIQYRPDFYLPGLDAYIEIKKQGFCLSEGVSLAKSKAHGLANTTLKHVLMFCGWLEVPTRQTEGSSCVSIIYPQTREGTYMLTDVLTSFLHSIVNEQVVGVHRRLYYDIAGKRIEKMKSFRLDNLDLAPKYKKPSVGLASGRPPRVMEGPKPAATVTQVSPVEQVENYLKTKHQTTQDFLHHLTPGMYPFVAWCRHLELNPMEEINRRASRDWRLDGVNKVVLVTKPKELLAMMAKAAKIAKKNGKETYGIG